MKQIIATLFLVCIFSPQGFAEEMQALKTRRDVDNYATGVGIVRNFKQQGGEINLNLVMRGMMDELTGEKLLLSESELRRVLATLRAGSPEVKSASLPGEMQQSAGLDAPASVNASRGEDTNLQQAVPQKESQSTATDVTDTAVQNNSMLASSEPSRGSAPSAGNAANTGTFANSSGTQSSAPSVSGTTTASPATNAGTLTASGNSSAGSSNSWQTGASDAQNVQISQLTPDGYVMSRTNQAKLSVSALKAEMRANVASGAIR